jgi:mono/diheme cytochrome c family protein
MTRPLSAAALAVLLAGTAACGRPAPAGDPAAGRAAFVELQCTACHEVAGDSLPPPATTPAVRLGGRMMLPPSPERTRDDILLPSSHFAQGYPREQIMSGEASRMPPNYKERLTDAQVANLVAYLQSHYARGLPSATQ